MSILTARQKKSPLCANCRDTYSIGVCASYQTPLCGKSSCSNLRAELRLCPKHAQRYDLEIAEAKAEEARQREERHKLAEQRARKLHDDIVAGRSKGSASDREIEAKVQELQRRIERAQGAEYSGSAKASDPVAGSANCHVLHIQRHKWRRGWYQRAGAGHLLCARDRTDRIVGICGRILR